MNRQNDWFAANLNRPEFGFDQMYASGITPDNTTLRDKDYYKNIQQVKDAFTDRATGVFNEEQFNDYYDGLARSYNDFSRTNFVDNWLKNMDSSPYDIFSDKPGTFDNTVRMIRNRDPQRHQIGVSGINVVGAPSWDEREVAQENFVRDENGNKLDWTPNQRGLWGALTGKTLVKATYDKDGYYEENGRRVFHKKGEAKYDENGDPYYELLGNRSVYGKDVLHVTDVITRDDSWVNQLDFLDSDSLDKSVFKTIMKSAAQIGLYAIPYAGPYIGAVKAIMDLSSVLPVVGKAFDGIVSGDTSDSFGKSMSKWEAFMSRFDRSQTQYAKEHQWSFENVGDMISNSAGQLYSQRIIGQIPLLFKNSKNLPQLQKIGQNISLGYMALTSAEDSYRTFKDAGANDTVAGLGFLATAASLYGLMNQDYFKEWLFKNSSLGFDPEMRFAVRQFAQEKGAQLTKELGLNTAKPVSKEAEQLFIKKWWNALKGFVTKYKDKIPTGKAYPMTLAYANHALNEGIEETMEEGVADIFKGIAEAAQYLGFNVTENGTEKLDFGWSPQEAFNRYLTSFVGGAVGGAVFEGLTRWENYWKNDFGKVDNLLDTPAKRRILWYLSNGYGDQLRAALNREHDLGHLGDKNLSWNGRQTIDASGKAVWTFDAVSGRSQNDEMYDAIKNVINTIEYQASSLGLILSDDRLKQLAMQRDDIIKIAEDNMKAAAQKEGLTLEEYKRKHRTNLMERVITEAGADDAIFSDAWKLKNRILALNENIVNKEAELRNVPDAEKSIVEERIKKDASIKKWQEELKQAQKDYNDLIEGKRASEYIGLAAFTHNNFLRNIYLLRDEKDQRKLAMNDNALYARLKYGVNYDTADNDMRNFIEHDRGVFSRADTLSAIREAYDIHRRMIEILDPTLKAIASEMDGYIMDSALEDVTVYDFYNKLINTDTARINEINTLLQSLDPNSDEFKILDNEKRLKELELERVRGAITNLDPNVLNRNVSVNEEATSFAEGVPFEFEENTNLAGFDIKNSLDTLEDYFNYLKSNKIILGYNNPVFSNVTKNVLNRFKENALEWMTRYGSMLVTEEDAIKTAQKINEIRYDFEEEAIHDPLANLMEGTANAENIAVSFGLLGVYKAKLIRALQEKARFNTLSEEEQAWLNLNSTISEEEISKYVDLNGNIIDKEINNLIDASDTLASKTTNFFAENSVYAKDLKSMLSNFVDTMSKEDFSNWDEKLNEMKDYVLNKIRDPELRTQIEENLFGLLNGVGEQLQRIKEIKAEIKPSPVTDLLENLTMLSGDEDIPVLDFLKQEISYNSSQDALNKYVMNPKSEKQLRRIKDLLPAVKAIIESMGLGGLNDTLNTYRTEDGLEDFIVLDDQRILMYNRELSYIESRINTLLQISDSHSESNADKQVAVQLNMRPKYMKKFIGSVKEPTLVKALNDAFGINTDELWASATEGTSVDVDNVTKDNYKEYFAAVRRWEKLVYDKFKEATKTLAPDEIGTKLGKSFANLENNAGTYDADENTEVTDLAAALYFLRIIGYDPNQYHALYKSILNREEDYPFDNQEMVIGMGFVAIQNSAIYNNLIKEIVVENKQGRTYIKNMSILESLISILGGNGTGKSKVVSKKIIDLLKASGKNIDVVATTTDPGRLSEMKDELSIESDAKTLVTSKLIKDLFGKDLDPDDYADSQVTGHPCLLSKDALKKVKSSVLKALYDEKSDIRVLALDEGTFESEAELQILCEAAKQANVFILLTGDLNQQYALRPYKVKRVDDQGKVTKEETFIDTSGLEDCIYGATPMLTTSMRASNEGMFADTQLFNIILNKAIAKAKSDPSIKTNDIIEDAVSLTLQYHETAVGFSGMKVVDNITDYVTKFDNFTKSRDKKPNVVIITDSDKYDALQNDNVIVMRPEAVQGREFEYAVIDVDLSKDAYAPKFTRLKAVNTWLSRARSGSVIVNKPQLSEVGSFEINSEDIPGASRSIDSKRDRPEELEAYKDWVDDVYSDVETPSAPSASGEDGGQGGGGTAGGGGTSDGGAGDGGSRFVGGAHTTSGKDVEEEIKQVIDDVLNSSTNSDGYKDEDHYRTHLAALAEDSDRSDFYSLEGFYRWLTSDEGDKVLFNGQKGSLFPTDATDEQKDRFRRFVQTVVYTIASNERSIAADVLDSKRDQFAILLNGINFTVDEVLDVLIDGLSNKNDSFGVFKMDPNADKRTSFVNFVFGNADSAFVIPMGNVRMTGQPSIYKEIDFRQNIPLSLISSKGRVHLPVSRFNKKLHLNRHGGVFVPITPESNFSDSMSDAARTFYNSKGRFYNIWDLDLESENEELAAKQFFTRQINENDNLLSDFTQSTGIGETRRIKGTHRVVSFKKYVEIQRAVTTVMRGENVDEINKAKKVLKNEFGKHLTDKDIEILQTNANYYSTQENIEFNADKRQVQRKVDLLSWTSRGNLSSALLRMSMEWWTSDDENKRDFAGKFLSSFITDFLLDGSTSRTYKNNEGSDYLHGFKLSFEGTNQQGIKRRGSIFVSVNGNGELVVEAAFNRKATDKAWKLNTGLKASSYLSVDHGYDIARLTRDVLQKVQGEEDSYLRLLNLYHDGTQLLTELGKFDGSQNDIDYIHSIFGDGTISILPAKRYHKIAKGEDPEELRYYNIYDSELVSMIPDIPSTFDATDEWLRKDEVFKYGMYASEYVGDYDRGNDNSEFVLKEIDNDSYLTDIVDIMLPAYDITVGEEENNNDILKMVNDLGEINPGSEDTNKVTFNSKDSYDEAVFESPINIDKDVLEKLVKNADQFFKKSSTLAVNRIELRNGKATLELTNGDLIEIGKASKAEVKQWLSGLGVQINDTSEETIASNADGYSIKWDGKTLSLFNPKTLKNKSLNLIGSQDAPDGFVIVASSEGNAIQIPIAQTISDKMDPILRHALWDSLSKVRDRGEYIMSDQFGHYYYKENDLIFIESGSNTPARNVIVAFEKDAIRLVDGTVITKNSDPEVYSKLKSIVDPATVESDPIITSYGTRYSIKGVLLSSNWIRNNCILNGQLIKSDSVMFITYDGNQIQIEDDGNNLTIALNDNGKKWVKAWLNTKSIVAGQENIAKLLKNTDLKSIRTELETLINSNPENLVESINQLLFDNAKSIGKVFKVDDSLKLIESQSKDSLCWLSLHKTLSKLGIDYTAEPIETVGNVHKYIVEFKSDQANYTEEWHVSEGDYKAVKFEKFDADFEAERDIRSQIDQIEDENDKQMLLEYLESRLMNGSLSDEVTIWYMMNVDRFEELTNRIDNLKKRAC